VTNERLLSLLRQEARREGIQRNNPLPLTPGSRMVCSCGASVGLPLGPFDDVNYVAFSCKSCQQKYGVRSNRNSKFLDFVLIGEWDSIASEIPPRPSEQTP